MSERHEQKCNVGACEEIGLAGGPCRKHVRLLRFHGRPDHRLPEQKRCNVVGCGEACFSEKYCLAHEVRLLRIFERYEALRERNGRTRQALRAAARIVGGDKPPSPAPAKGRTRKGRAA